MSVMSLTPTQEARRADLHGLRNTLDRAQTNLDCATEALDDAVDGEVEGLRIERDEAERLLDCATDAFSAEMEEELQALEAEGRS